MNDTEVVAKASFLLGVGVMGLLAGLGVGGKSPNKAALVVGAGALVYANYLNPVLKTDPFVAEQFNSSYQSARAAAPAVTQWAPPDSRADVTFSFGR